MSILSQEMIGKFFTKNTVKDISELIDGELNVMAANGTKIAYSSWTEIEV